MRRRSRAGGEAVKTRRRKTVTLKRHNAPKAVRRRGSSAAREETKIARLTNELNEARQQQTATADVLRVISRSAFDLQAVLSTLTELAARLCAADLGLIVQQDGEVLRPVASFGISSEAERYWIEHPVPVGRGTASGRALLEGRAIQIPDVLADPEYRATRHSELAGYRSSLGVPLLREGTTIGVFGLGRREPKPFTENQIELVTTFADQAVIAIENARLFEAEQQRTRELTELLEQQTATSEVLRVISSSPADLQPVFEAMLESATRICEANFGAMFRLENGAVRMVTRLRVPERLSQFLQKHGDSFGPLHPWSRLIQSRRTLHIADYSNDGPIWNATL